ncbi:MAG: NAD(P)H-hydrate dehydratase [Hydrogenophilales bacterium 28-61-23]|nr:MAG: NAD(P)H-hydrate dehydratase [Hydrogenophilales bacterium 28-61-23]
MPTTLTIAADSLPARLAARRPDSHKGDYGSVGILGGSPGMVGAVLLAGRAALYCGAGRVYVGSLDDRLTLDPVCPELMIVAAEAIPALSSPACLVIGPGLGLSGGARRLLANALRVEHSLLLDADALNLIARDAELLAALTLRRHGISTRTIITPHPGEAARLLGVDTGAIQADRESAIRELVALTGATVVLKGHASLVHSPGQPIWRNTTGNPGMAAPGMGDVLAGMIAALQVQGLGLEHAAVLAVWLHGQAGDDAVAAGCGPAGLTASEVVGFARRALARLQSSDKEG